MNRVQQCVALMLVWGAASVSNANPAGDLYDVSLIDPAQIRATPPAPGRAQFLNPPFLSSMGGTVSGTNALLTQQSDFLGDPGDPNDDFFEFWIFSLGHESGTPSSLFPGLLAGDTVSAQLEDLSTLLTSSGVPWDALNPAAGESAMADSVGVEVLFGVGNIFDPRATVGWFPIDSTVAVVQDASDDAIVPFAFNIAIDMDSEDLIGATALHVTVPEPSTAMLLFVAATALIRRRPRKDG